VGRSIRKGPFVDPNLAIKVRNAITKRDRNPIKTWARASTITPDCVELVFMVHNGKQHVRVQVTEDMVGHKLGEFAPTRNFRGHTNKKEAARKAGPK
jgi:small subunit ribosomal protein S19